MNQLVNLRISDQYVSKVQIISSGIFLPKKIVTSNELFECIRSDVLYDMPFDWMSRFIGIKERRMADENSLPSDLAIPAARDAIDNCEYLDTDQIDMVLFCGIERDQPEPATAHTIQCALGLNARYALDVGNACFGFIHGMEIAETFIKSGLVRYALVVTGEVPTKVLNSVVDHLKTGIPIDEAKLLFGALTVGDAGGAVILGQAEPGNISGFELFNGISDSDHIDKCIYRRDSNGIPTGQMQMGAINGMVQQLHEGLIDDTLNTLDWDGFDWVLVHQTGLRPFVKFGDLRGVHKDKMIKTFDKLGNITSATFPVNYNSLQKSGNVLLGDRIGGVFAGSGLAIGQFGYTY